MLSARAQGDGERPATFREVLGVSEFRVIYAASILSWAGDYIARAAVTFLVFQVTSSAAISAAAFAISYAPYLLGGSVLVSLADRYSYRSVMIFGDLARMVIMATIALALPWLPLSVVLLLLLASALFSPPFDAARSATVPTVLHGDRYVVGVALLGATSQPVQVLGYFAGAAIAAGDPRLALLVNAGSFAVSALLIRLGVRSRRPTLDSSAGTHLFRETVDGIRFVFATSVLRAPVLLVLCGAVFAVVPEALAAAWASGLAPEADRGWSQGLIMGSVPLGSILGALTVSRFAPPSLKTRLMRPLALATPLVLVPSLLNPQVTVVATMAGLCGFAIGALVPIANGQFVRTLPQAYRARAFGVVQGGLALLQGSAVLLTGLWAHDTSVPMVVGLWSLGGVVLMIVLSLTWPSQREFAEAAASANLDNAAGMLGPSTAAAETVTADRSESGVDEDAAHTIPSARSAPGATRQSGLAGAPGTMES